jgi:hypothetical protein
MKMRVKRTKQFRHGLQGWFESTGYLARLKAGREHRKMLRERILRGDYEVIEGEFWMKDLL